MATSYYTVIDSFESSFVDRIELPDTLERQWFKKAVSYYSQEVTTLTFNEDTDEFDSDLNPYTIDVLAKIIKVYYLEREVSRVNKITSIVGADLSVNGSNGLQKYTKTELDSTKSELTDMFCKLKDTAYN